MADTATVKLIARFQNRMSAGLRNLGRGVRNLGVMFAAATVAVLAMTKKIADYGAQIYDTATITGVGVERIQAFGYAFEQTGGQVETFQAALRGLTTFMRMADSATSEQGMLLEKLGLQYEALATMDADVLFLTLTDALSKSTSSFEQLTDAATIFGGRYSQQVVGLINQSGRDVRSFLQDFEDLGIALSVDQVTALKQYSDAMTKMDHIMKGLMADALVPLLPALQDAQVEFIATAEIALPKLLDALVGIVPVALDVLSVMAGLAAKFADIVQIAKDSGDGIGNTAEGLNVLADALQNQVAQSFMTGADAADILDAAIDNVTGDIYTMDNVLNETADGQARLEQWASGVSRAIGTIGEQSAVTTDELTGLLGRINDLRGATEEVTEVNPFAGLMEEAAPFFDQLMTWVDEQVEAGGGDPVGISLSSDAMVELMTKAEEFAEWEAGYLSDKGRQLAKLGREEERRHDQLIENIESASEAQNLAAQKQHDALNQEASIRNAMMISARANATQWTLALIEAGRQGEEAVKAWADQVISQLIRIASMKVFGLILSLFGLGGVGDILGKIGGIAGGGKTGGGTIPGAAGGMVVPGAGNQDNIWVRVAPREEILTERQRQEVDRLRQGGGAGGGISIGTFNFGPMFSDASPSQVARSLKTLERIQRKG